MNVVLVQGTWGDDDGWWKRGNNSFADAVVAAGHTLVNGRMFEWDCDLGGIGFGMRDLNGWRYAGLHLWDRLDPPLCRASALDPASLCIIFHSHGRQVGKFAFAMGLKAATAIFVSGPIRKDVDAATTGWKANVARSVGIHGGKTDRMQLLGSLFDHRLGFRRDDPEFNTNVTYADAGHSTLLTTPSMYSRVLHEIHP